MDAVDSRKQLNTVQLASLINKPPHVFMGCTAVELNAVAMLSVLCFVAISILIAVLFQVWSLAIGTGVLVACAVFYTLIHLLSWVKRSKPEEHYMLIMLKWRARLFSEPNLVIRSGTWSVSRYVGKNGKLK